MTREESSSPRVRFIEDQHIVGKRTGGPIPRRGERVSFSSRFEGDAAGRHFDVIDVEYFLDGGPDAEETGMLVTVEVRAVEDVRWTETGKVSGRVDE